MGWPSTITPLLPASIPIGCRTILFIRGSRITSSPSSSHLFPAFKIASYSDLTWSRCTFVSGKSACKSKCLLLLLRLSCKSACLFYWKASVYVQRTCNFVSGRFLSPFVQKKARKVSNSQIKVEDDLSDDACELVSGAELTVGDGDDAIPAYLFKAVKNNNGTGILLLSDIFGFEDSCTRDFAYRVACNGYNVLVPDLFRGDPWGRDRPRALLENWLARQDPASLAKDIDTSTKWMLDEFVAAGISKKLGLIGFCFGGGRVVDVLARDQNSCFGTGVSFYGTRMDRSAAANVKVPVLFVSGDNDPLCPVNVLTELEKIVGSGSKVVIFEGRGQGFAHRPESPEEDADAEQSFLTMRNWLHSHLAVSEDMSASSHISPL